MEREEDVDPFSSYLIHPPPEFTSHTADPSLATPNQDYYTTESEAENSLYRASSKKLEPRRNGM
jgi:hypothetical protein